MPAEPLIVYDPPYGGQAIRARNPRDAWGKVEAFLSSSTDTAATGPTSVGLAVYESGEPEWWTRAVDEASALFGAGTRRAWVTGAREEFRTEWELAPSLLTRALDLLARWEPFPRTDFGPAQVTTNYQFRWVDPTTRAVLPGQRPDLRAHPTQAASDLLVSLGRRSSAILSARFPFAEPGPAFVSYLRQVMPHLPITLNPARLRLWVPTKEGGGFGYRPRRVVVDVAER